MRIEQVDERSSSWEDASPRFRVYFFHLSGEREGSSYAADTYDVTEADVLEVLRWAAAEAAESWLYAVALVRDEPSRGLVWLVGMDANDTPGNEVERRRLQEMRDRLGMEIVRQS